MNPIDGAGNLLNEKDAVVVHIGGAVLLGQITKIDEASILILSPIPLMFNPMAPSIPSVFKIVKPPNWDKPES